MSRGAVTEDALSVAAPVTDPSGQVVAAVSLVVAVQDARPQALAPLVRTAARGISRAYAAPAAEDRGGACTSGLH